MRLMEPDLRFESRARIWGPERDDKVGALSAKLPGSFCVPICM